MASSSTADGADTLQFGPLPPSPPLDNLRRSPNLIPHAPKPPKSVADSAAIAKRVGAPKAKGAVRAKSGCYTCRLRRKKCDGQQDEQGRCSTCVRLRLECLGFGPRRPEWLREKRNVSQQRDKIKNFLASQGLIRGHSSSGSAERPSVLRLTLTEDNSSSESGSSSSALTPSQVLSNEDSWIPSTMPEQADRHNEDSLDYNRLSFAQSDHFSQNPSQFHDLTQPYMYFTPKTQTEPDPSPTAIDSHDLDHPPDQLPPYYSSAMQATFADATHTPSVTPLLGPLKTLNILSTGPSRADSPELPSPPMSEGHDSDQDMAVGDHRSSDKEHESGHYEENVLAESIDPLHVNAPPRKSKDEERILSSLHTAHHRILQNRRPSTPLGSTYHNIFSAIPLDIIPTTRQILWISCFAKTRISAQALANFLGLDASTFYRSLYQLRSVLDMPRADLADRLPVLIADESFEAYFKNTLVEGSSMIETHLTIMKQFVEWCYLWSTMVNRSSNEKASARLPWPGKHVWDDVVRFVAAELWRFCNQFDETMSISLCRLDFAAHSTTGLLSQKIWPDLHEPAPQVSYALCRLNKWQISVLSKDTHIHVLRTKPMCLTDYELLTQFKYVLNLEQVKEADFEVIQSNASEWSYACLSLKTQLTGLHSFHSVRKAFLNFQVMYFFLGEGEKSCLVIVYQPNLSIARFINEALHNEWDRHREGFRAKTMEPTPEDVGQLIVACDTPQIVFDRALLPSLARTVVAYICHPDNVDPDERLQRALRILSHYSDQTSALEQLRKESMSEIPLTMQPIAESVLAFILCYSSKAESRSIPAKQIAQFLNLETDVVEEALRRSNLALSRCPLLYPMGAVTDFDLNDLLDYCSGGQAATIPDAGSQGSLTFLAPALSPQIWTGISVHFIHWCDTLFTLQRDELPVNITQEDEPTPDAQAREESSVALFNEEVLAGGHWIAFSQVSEDDIPQLLPELRKSCFFRVAALACDFRLAPHDMAPYFCLFANKLFLHQRLEAKPLIRVQRQCDTDDRLLERWMHVASSLNPADFPIKPMSTTFYFTTAQTNWAQGSFSDKWCGFWLGHEENTCLVTFQVEGDGGVRRG